MVALATPIVVDEHPVYVLNMSVATEASIDSVAGELGPALLDLAAKLHDAIGRV